MNQTCQIRIHVSDAPFRTTASSTALAHDSESTRKDLSIGHSVTACAVLLACIALYMCVGFAALALVERAWLAVFE